MKIRVHICGSTAEKRGTLIGGLFSDRHVRSPQYAMHSFVINDAGGDRWPPSVWRDEEWADRAVIVQLLDPGQGRLGLPHVCILSTTPQPLMTDVIASRILLELRR